QITVGVEGNAPNEGGALPRRMGGRLLSRCYGLAAWSEIGGGGLACRRHRAGRSLARGRCRRCRPVALPLREPFQGLMHRRKRVVEAGVGWKGWFFFGPDIGIEALLALGRRLPFPPRFAM